MSVNVPLLVLAIVLLWFPRSWLRLGRVLNRRRARSGAQKTTEPWNEREPGDPRVHFAAEFMKFRNYVDLIRAAVGAICVMGQWKIDPCVAPAAGASSGHVIAVMAVKSVILLIGLLIQTVRFERRLTFFPPVFFIAGLSLPLCTAWGAFFAFVLIWAVNPMLGNAQGFLFVYAVLLGVFGIFFDGLGSRSTILASVLCFLPALLSLMAGKTLIIPARKGTHASDSSS
jgi:hypothetical protein